MAIGLDVGTGFLVSAKKVENDVVEYRSVRDAFIHIDKSLFNERMFNKNKIKYIEIKGEIYIVGENALTFAKIQNRAAKRPLASGIINPSERQSAPILKELISNILKFGETSEKVVFSIPGPSLTRQDFDTNYHSMSIASLLRNLDFNGVALNEAYAILVSELEATDDVTGLGISFGAGLVNCSLVYKGIPLFEFSIDKSGDFVDSQAAKAVNVSEAVISHIKENNLDLNSDEFEAEPEIRALIFSYRYMIQNVVAEIKKAFTSQNKANVTEAFPIIISGGTTLPNGFLQMFAKEMESAKIPFKYNEIRGTKDRLRAVAHGCMLFGEEGDYHDNEY